MIKVSFILDTDPDAMQHIDLAQVLEAMHAAVDDITGHLESVSIYPDMHDVEQTMCVEYVKGGAA